MFNHVAIGAKIKVYLHGGADITGEWVGLSDLQFVANVTAPNGKHIAIRADDVSAVVTL